MGANRPDGILAYNDLAAMGLMKVARDLSVRIPEDVAVVGIGDIPFAALVSPPLTTAAVPSLEIGRLAATLLMQKLEGLEILEPALVLRAKLCIRASTRIEEKQRRARKEQETKKFVYKPMYFKEVYDDLTGELNYQYCRDYWDDMKNGKIDHFPDIY